MPPTIVETPKTVGPVPATGIFGVGAALGVGALARVFCVGVGVDVGDDPGQVQLDIFEQDGLRQRPELQTRPA